MRSKTKGSGPSKEKKEEEKKEAKEEEEEEEEAPRRRSRGGLRGEGKLEQLRFGGNENSIQCTGNLRIFPSPECFPPPHTFFHWLSICPKVHLLLLFAKQR